MDLSGNVSVQTSTLNPCFNNNVQRDSASQAQVGHCLKVKYDSLQIVSVTWDFCLATAGNVLCHNITNVYQAVAKVCGFGVLRSTSTYVKNDVVFAF